MEKKADDHVLGSLYSWSNTFPEHYCGLGLSQMFSICYLWQQTSSHWLWTFYIFLLPS